MKPTSSFFKLLIPALILVAGTTRAQFPCISQFSTTDNGNGSFYFASNSYMYGAQSYSGGYTWDFGDGRTDYTYNGPNGVTQANITQGSCVPYVTHQYVSNGTFIVTLYAHYWNSTDTCTGVSTDTIVISGLPCPHPQIQNMFISDSTFLFTGTAPGIIISNAYWNVQPAGISYTADTLLMSFPYGTPTTLCYHVTGTCDGNAYTDSVCTSVYLPVPSSPNCHASFTMFEDTTNNGSWFAYNTSTGNNLNYVWDFGDSTTSTQPYPYHTYATPGHYTICLTVFNDSCYDMFCDTSAVHRLSSAMGMMSSFNVLTPAGIQQETGSSSVLSVAPNPFEDQIAVRLSSDKNKIAELILYDALGKKLLQRTVNCSPGENRFELDVHEAVKGIYSLVVSDGTGWCKTVKVVK